MLYFSGESKAWESVVMSIQEIPQGANSRCRLRSVVLFIQGNIIQPSKEYCADTYDNIEDLKNIMLDGQRYKRSFVASGGDYV
jgi:hypothetical protein